MACNGAGCAAYGNYRNSAGVAEWMLDSAINGGWTTTTASPLPSTSSASSLSDISCGAADSCVIVGENTDSSNHLYGLVETFAGGAWTNSLAAQPADANTTQPYSYLTGVSCQDGTDCAAVGSYAGQTSSAGGGLIDMLSGGTWTGYAAAPGFPLALYGVACDPNGMCVAPGGNGDVIVLNAPAPPPLTISPSSLPDGVNGVAYSAQLTASGGAATPDTFSLASGALPAGLSLSSAGLISGTPTSSGTSKFTVQVADSASPRDTGTANLTITVLPIEVTSTTLPAAPIDAAYKTTLTAVGGTKPYTWKLMSGTLPKGLTLASTGVVSGTPTVLGTSTFTVQVTDSATPTHATATAAVSLTVIPMSVATTSLPDAPIYHSYSVTLKAAGGKPTLVWSLASGTLPAGLKLSSAGVISGTPTAVGSSSFTVRVHDAEVPAEVATQTLSLTVTPLTITTTSLPAAPANHSYSVTLKASGGKPTLVWSLASGTLPAGLTLSSAGVISGTPTLAGSSIFTVRVHDAAVPQQIATRTLTLTVTPLTITTTSLPNGSVGKLYSAALTATGGKGTLVFSVTSGSLPPGIKMSSTGVFSGTPTTAGSYGYTVSVHDSATPPNWASRALSITVT